MHSHLKTTFEIELKRNEKRSGTDAFSGTQKTFPQSLQWGSEFHKTINSSIQSQEMACWDLNMPGIYCTNVSSDLRSLRIIHEQILLGY